MSCTNVCQLCPRFIISSAVNFDAANNNLLIQIPTGTYRRGEKYCIVVAQEIPATTTRTARVFITIGTDATLYPLVRCNCLQVTACSIRERTKYSTVIVTDTVTGVFKLLGNVPCDVSNAIASLPIVAPVAPATPANFSVRSAEMPFVTPNTTSVTKTTTTTTVSNKTTGGVE